MESSAPPPPPPPPGDGPSAGGGADVSQSLRSLRKRLREKKAASPAAARHPASSTPSPLRHTVLSGGRIASRSIPAPPRVGNASPPRHHRHLGDLPQPTSPASIPLPSPSPTASSTGSLGELIRPPHLGEGLEECLKSLRKYALETMSEVTGEDDKRAELTKVIKAAKDVVKSFYKNIWFTEGCQRAARKPFNTFKEFKKISVLEYNQMMEDLPQNLDNLLLVHFNKDWNDTNRHDEVQVLSNPIPNTHCPITGVPVAIIQDPVRSIDCCHVYDRSAIMQYIQNKRVPVFSVPKLHFPRFASV